MKRKIRIGTGVVLAVLGLAVIYIGVYWLLHTWNRGWIWFAGQGLLLSHIAYVVIRGGDVWKTVRYAIMITALSALLISRNYD